MEEVFKFLFWWVATVLLLLGLPFVIMRMCEVSGSEAGLWSERPHSGACPESPTWEGGEQWR